MDTRPKRDVLVDRARTGDADDGCSGVGHGPPHGQSQEDLLQGRGDCACADTQQACGRACHQADEGRPGARWPDVGIIVAILIGAHQASDELVDLISRHVHQERAEQPGQAVALATCEHRQVAACHSQEHAYDGCRDQPPQHCGGQGIGLLVGHSGRGRHCEVADHGCGLVQVLVLAKGKDHGRDHDDRAADPEQAAQQAHDQADGEKNQVIHEGFRF